MAIIIGSLYYIGSHIFGCASGGGATFLAVPVHTEAVAVIRTGNSQIFLNDDLIATVIQYLLIPI